MKCNVCGASGFSGSSCPDCTSDDILDDGNSQSATVTDLAAAPPMPAIGMTAVVTPLISTLTLPGPEKQRFELREDGDLFIAHVGSAADRVDHRVENDETVSNTPVRIFTRDGKTYATGGGVNGFSIITTVRHKPTDEIEVPRGAIVHVGIGDNTKVRVR